VATALPAIAYSILGPQSPAYVWLAVLLFFLVPITAGASVITGYRLGRKDDESILSDPPRDGES
jgi:hypothetical protein